MPDYQAIVKQNADALGARIVDLNSPQAFRDLVAEGWGSKALDLVVDPDDRNAFSSPVTKTLYVGLPIKSELGCFIAMHELGHIAHGEPKEGHATIEDEANASQWALDHCGFTPSPSVAREALDALASYENDPHTGRSGPIAFRLHKELESIEYGK